MRAPGAALFAVTAVSTVVALAVGVLIRRRERSRATALFLLTSACLGVWGLLVLARMPLSEPGPLLALFYLDLPVSLLAVLSFLLFAAEYTGRSWLTGRRGTLAVGAVWAVTSGVVLTHPLHGAAFATLDPAGEPFGHVAVGIGPGYSLFRAVAIGGAVLGVGLFVRAARRSRRVSRNQFLAVAVGGGFGVLSALPRSLGLVGTVLPPFEYPLVGTGAFYAVVGVGLYRHALFETTPVARDRLLDALSEAVVVVDGDGTVVDYNEAAARTFPDLEDADDRPAGAVLDLPVAAGVDRTVTRFVDGDRRRLHVSVDPVDAGDRAGGGAGPGTGPVPGSDPGDEGNDSRADAHGDGDRADAHGHRAGDAGTGGDAGAGGAPSPVRAVVVSDVTAAEEYGRQLDRQREAVDEFASVISHDLRNPLNVAHVHADVLDRRYEDDDHPEAVLEALDRMEDIVEDVLTLAREGGAVTDRSLVSLSSVVRDALDTVDRPPEAETTVAVPEAARVYADRSRLRTLFENLLRNVEDHAGPGTAVRVELLDGEDGFAVEDDGPGIDPGDRETVFEKGHTTAEGGTGLGLSIVAAIAEAHGWSVAATDPAVLEGARFEVRDVEVRRGNDGARESAAGAGSGSSPDLRGDQTPDPRADSSPDLRGDSNPDPGSGSDRDSGSAPAPGTD